MTTQTNLQQTRALVTGASRGIGRAIAIALARSGANVALVARTPEHLADTAKACAEHKVKVVRLGADLADASQAKAIVRGAVEGLGGLDVLINNAGVFDRSAADAGDLATWDHVIDVNVRALIHLTRHALPEIERSKRGAIINIASVASKVAHAGGAIYCASKHAVLGFSNAVFEDVRERGIKVCAICPGYVSTDMTRDVEIDHAKALQPDDIAQAALYVLSCSDTACPTEILLRPQRAPQS